ncbi:MAG: hypothetical protein ACLR23_24155 [Clostridia bacterium]
MKKFAAFSLTLMMVISLAACAGNSEPAETNSPDVESSVVDETSASETQCGRIRAGNRSFAAR